MNSRAEKNNLKKTNLNTSFFPRVLHIFVVLCFVFSLLSGFSYANLQTLDDAEAVLEGTENIDITTTPDTVEMQTDEYYDYLLGKIEITDVETFNLSTEEYEEIEDTDEAPKFMATTADVDLWDLANFQDSFKIKDTGNNEIELTDEFTYDTAYWFEICFDIPNIIDGVMSFPAYIDGFLIYQLPVGIDILQNSQGNIYLDDNPINPIGTYIIEGNADSGSEIKVHFFDIALVDGEIIETEGTNLLDTFFDLLYFTVDFQAQFVKNDNGDEFSFGKDIIITVIEEEPTPTLSIKKDNGVYNEKNRTLDYSIKISSYSDDLLITKIVDTLTFGTDETLESIFSGRPLSDFVNNAVIRVDGQIIDSSDYSISWVVPDYKELEIVFTGSGIPLESGQLLTLDYTFDLDEIITTKGSYPYLNYSLPIGNKADVYAEAGDIEIDDSYSITTWITSIFSSKYGSYNADTNQITWTASSGDYSKNLNGFTINDILSDVGMSPLGTLQIILKDINGIEIYNETNHSGFPINLTYNTSENGGFTFTLPTTGIGSPAKDVYRVEFIYTVDIVSEGISDETMSNTFSIDNGTESDEVKSNNVVIHRGEVGVTKTGELIFDDPIYGDYVQWQIEYSVPGNLYGLPVWFEDEMNLCKSEWEIEEQEDPPFNLIDFQIDCTDSSFTPIFSVHDNGEYYHNGTYYETYSPTYPVAGQNMSLVYRPTQHYWPSSDWYLYFNPNGTYDIESYNCTDSYIREMSLSPFKNDTVVTVSYKTPLDTLFSGSAEEMTLLEYLKHNDSNPSEIHNLKNNSSIKYVLGTSDSIWNPTVRQDDASIYYPIHKYAEIIGDRIDYTVLLQVGLINEEEIFVDIFDADILEYLPYSLRADMSGSMYYGPYKFDQTPPAPPVIDYIETNLVTNNNAITYNFFELQSYYDGSTWFLEFDADGNPKMPGGINWGGVKPPKYTDIDEKYWAIRYSLKLKEGIEIKRYTDVVNTITVGDYSNECSVTVGENAITKTMTVNPGGTASVEIIINPLGLKVLPPSASTNIFRSEDRMSSNLVLIPNSLMFYIPSTDSEDEEWETYSHNLAVHTDENDALPYTYRVIDPQSVDFWFPDETPIRITYSVKGLATTDNTYSNEISILEYIDSVVLEGFEVDESAGKGNLHVTNLLVEKQDVQTKTLLSGVELGVYVSIEYTRNFSENMQAADDNGYPKTFELGEMTFYYIDDSTTDEGFLTFYKELYSQDKFKDKNIVYAIYEKEAPPGYYGPRGCDIENHDDLLEHLHMFYFQYPFPSTIEFLEDTLGLDVYNSNGSVEVFNTRIQGDPGEYTDLTFTKVDENDIPLANVCFALYSCDNNDHQHDWLVSNETTDCWDDAIYVYSDIGGTVMFPYLTPSQYMLVEIETQEGYQLPYGQWFIEVDNLLNINISAHGVNVATLPPAFKYSSLEPDELLLPNYPKLNIPSSGKTGGVTITILGVVLLGGAVIFYIVSIPKNRKRMIFYMRK